MLNLQVLNKDKSFNFSNLFLRGASVEIIALGNDDCYVVIESNGDDKPSTVFLDKCNFVAETTL